MHRKKSLRSKMELQYMTLLIPALILFTIGIMVPIFLCVYYSFTEWDGFSKYIHFVGFSTLRKASAIPASKAPGALRWYLPS